MKNNALLSLLLLLTLAACNPEQFHFKKELQLAVPELNSRCPVRTPIGSMERIYLEQDSLCTLFRIAPTYAPLIADNASLLTDPSLLPSFLLLSLSEDTTLSELKPYLADMGQYGVWLRMKMDDPKSGQSVRIYASPALIDSVFTDKFSPRQKALVRVRLQMALTQRHLPYQVNSQMTMTSISLTDHEVLFSYLMEEDASLNLGREDIRTTARIVVRNRIWGQLMRLTERSAQQLMLDYYTAGYRLRYRCTGSESGGEVEFLLTQGDMRMLLSHYGIHVP